MKPSTLLILLSLNYAMCAQNTIFVRVYDLSGNKIEKGHVLAVTDTSLQLERNPLAVNIPVQSIGSIRTKHAGGNNALIGSATGVCLMAIVGAATAEPDAAILPYSAGEGALAGALLGLPLGAALGSLTIIFKNSKFYAIDGDITKWKAFQIMVTDNNINKTSNINTNDSGQGSITQQIGWTRVSNPLACGNDLCKQYMLIIIFCLCNSSRGLISALY